MSELSPSAASAVATGGSEPLGANHGSPSDPVLAVNDLRVHFPIRSGFFVQRQTGSVRAVDGVTFSISPGETLGLVGESGSGKTTIGRAIVGLVSRTSGTIEVRGQDIDSADRHVQRALRRDVQLIFQNPHASLNPRMTIGNIIADPLRVHGIGNEPQRRARVEEVMRLVGLNPLLVNRYPHQFSGGQLQRVGVARALVLSPSLVICDEPVSALDVSIQAQILNLLADLRASLGLSYLFIGHDLAVVRHVADRLAVVYLGKVMEIADREAIYARPRHPYTQALLSAVHIPDPALERLRRSRVIGLAGEIPSPATPPAGCRFSTRCPLRERLGRPDDCTTAEPALRAVGERQLIACHFPETEGAEVKEGTRSKPTNGNHSTPER